jgi:hypothetical protein
VGCGLVFCGPTIVWNRELTKAEAKILPFFNRCAIFSTTSHSYHGHPAPLTCPPDRTRKFIANLLLQQLEMAAILFFPVLVQVDQHIDAAVDLELRVIAVVGMNFERPPGA